MVRKTQKLKVVGIIEEEPYGGMRTVSRGRIFLPVDLTEKLNMAQFTDMRSSLRGGGGKTYMTLTVRVKDPGKVAQVQDAINKMGFRTFSVLDATKSLRRFFTVLDLFLGIFGSLALAVATLAIINTLVMAVLERRREIGVMKAIGASDGDVKRLFFAEAGAMGFFGGVLGIALGFAIGKAINVGTGIYLHRHQLPAEAVWILPPWLIGAAIAFSIVVSLLAGLYPASRAAKLDPVQVDSCAHVDGFADGESQYNAQHTSEEAHGAGFGEEQTLHVAIAGANRLHYANFAPAFQHRHHQRIDDGQRCHGQRQRAKYAEEEIEHGEEAAQALRGVEHREGTEAHLVDGVLHLRDLARIFDAHGQRHVGFAATAAQASCACR